MACKNNRRNYKRAVYYHINKFDYEAREKLAAGQLLLKEIPKEKTVVKPNPENEWTETWTPKITIVQTTPQKA